MMSLSCDRPLACKKASRFGLSAPGGRSHAARSSGSAFAAARLRRANLRVACRAAAHVSAVSVRERRLVDQTGVSWNQLASWLKAPRCLAGGVLERSPALRRRCSAPLDRSVQPVQEHRAVSPRWSPATSRARSGRRQEGSSPQVTK